MVAIMNSFWRSSKPVKSPSVVTRFTAFHTALKSFSRNAASELSRATSPIAHPASASSRRPSVRSAPPPPFVQVALSGAGLDDAIDGHRSSGTLPPHCFLWTRGGCKPAPGRQRDEPTVWATRQGRGFCHVQRFVTVARGLLQWRGSA